MSSELLLYVWDYNYSSWSMRAGLALRQTGAPFREVSVHGEGSDVAALKALSPLPAAQARHGMDLGLARDWRIFA
ncbi:MAG: hypothetical protein WDO69_05685 [Pseudomonadota bacterium]